MPMKYRADFGNLAQEGVGIQAGAPRFGDPTINPPGPVKTRPPSPFARLMGLGSAGLGGIGRGFMSPGFRNIFDASRNATQQGIAQYEKIRAQQSKREAYKREYDEMMAGQEPATTSE